MFAKVAPLMGCHRDARLLWLLVTVVRSVPCVWGDLTDLAQNVDMWHGWLVLFVTDMCFSCFCARR